MCQISSPFNNKQKINQATSLLFLSLHFLSLNFLSHHFLSLNFLSHHFLSLLLLSLTYPELPFCFVSFLLLFYFLSPLSLSSSSSSSSSTICSPTVDSLILIFITFSGNFWVSLQFLGSYRNSNQGKNIEERNSWWW